MNLTVSVNFPGGGGGGDLTVEFCFRSIRYLKAAVNGHTVCSMPLNYYIVLLNFNIAKIHIFKEKDTSDVWLLF